ncbi:MAG: hypothetical protein ACXAB0_07255 [Candidatus Thorarchaeota archaeon]
MSPSRFSRSVLVVLCLILCLNAIPYSPRVSANLGNITSTRIGSPFTNSSNIEMPEADVDIRLVRTEETQYTIDIRCNFTIETNETRNHVLAFVYPNNWNYSTVISSASMQISYEGVSVDTTMMSLQELNDTYGIDLTSLYSEYNHFAVFEQYITEGEAHTVLVDSTFHRTVVADLDVFRFSYYFGSARSFTGDTHETVRIIVDELVELEGLSFSPEEALTSLNYEGWTRTIASFDFYVSEMTDDWIVVAAVHQLPSGIFSPQPATVTFFGVITIVLLLIGYCAISGRFSKRLRTVDVNYPKVHSLRSVS